MIEVFLLTILFIAILCLVAFLKRSAYALLGLIFLSIIWPNYIVYKTGNLPGLTPPRAIMLLLLSALFMILTCNRLYRIKLGIIYKKFRAVFIVLLLSIIVNILSIILHSGNQIGACFAVINDFLAGPLLMILILLLLDTHDKQKKLYSALLIAFFVINLIGLAEWFNNGPLFSGYLVSATEHTIIKEKVRGGSYRLMSVFENSLVFSQLLLMSVPLWLYTFLNSKRLMRILVLFNVGLTAFLLINTRSRAAIGLLLSFPLLYLYSQLYLKSSSKIIKSALIYIPTLILVVGSIYFLDNFNYFIQQSTIGGTGEEETSTIARYEQLEIGINAMMEHPLFGYGPGGGVELMYPRKSIDNLYLTIVLDNGFIGLFLFLLLNLLVFKYSLQKKSIGNREIYINLSICLILLFFFILSIDAMMTLYYILAAMILQATRDVNDEKGRTA